MPFLWLMFSLIVQGVKLILFAFCLPRMVADSFDLFDFFLLFSLARRRLTCADHPDVLVAIGVRDHQHPARARHSDQDTSQPDGFTNPIAVPLR